MYERKHQRPLSHGAFVRRLLQHLAIGGALIAGSLAIGIAGYMQLEHLSLRLGFLNAAMLLGGMGPVNMPVTPAGQVFAGCYALYAGLLFLVLTALLLTPVLHRLLHSFHWVDDDAASDAPGASAGHVRRPRDH